MVYKPSSRIQWDSTKVAQPASMTMPTWAPASPTPGNTPPANRSRSAPQVLILAHVVEQGSAVRFVG